LGKNKEAQVRDFSWIPPDVLARWPDCSVADCRNKVYLGGKVPSDMCCPHMFRLPMNLDGACEYIMSDEEFALERKRLGWKR
jgi:hypothetical protein